MRVLAFSGGKDSMACLHLMAGTLDCAIYVDTGKAYPETKKLVEYASRLVPMVTVTVDRDEQNSREGVPSDVVPIDYTPFGQLISGSKKVTVQSYLNCCFENISIPLLRKAQELGATEIVYGQRSDEQYKSTSTNGAITEGLVRLHPIEDWTSEEVLEYLATKMLVPEHFKIKHSSLDCYDCTAFRNVSKDRVAFTQDKYPEFYAEYSHRLARVREALRDVLGEEI